jgi:hypothetical protein
MSTDTPLPSPEGRAYLMITELSTTVVEQIKRYGYPVDIVERGLMPWQPDPINGCRDDFTGIIRYLSDIRTLCEESMSKWIRSGLAIYLSDTYCESANILVPIAYQQLNESGSIPLRPTPEIQKGHADLLQSARLGLNGSTNLPSHEAVLYRTMMDGQRNQRPFISVQGYVGLAPDHVREGDVVVIFVDAKLPHVLRDNGNGTYRLVGEAYVHGVMNGELLDNDEEIKEYILG